MKRFITFLKSSMFRCWFMITAILTVSSACPCPGCGKPACPAGLGGVVVLGGVISFFGVLIKFINRSLILVIKSFLNRMR